MNKGGGDDTKKQCVIAKKLRQKQSAQIETLIQ